jgi:hypothetical protein
MKLDVPLLRLAMEDKFGQNAEFVRGVLGVEEAAVPRRVGLAAKKKKKGRGQRATPAS